VISLFKKRNTNFVLNSQAGFSILELLLVLGIFTVITTVTLISYSKFNSQTLLNSLAYDVALSLREAQTYAFSVRESPVLGGGFTSGYGIYFDAGFDNAYAFFSDVNQNKIYDHNPSDTIDPFCNQECIERFDLRGYTIGDVCAVLVDDSAHCFSNSTLTQLSITFERPNPDAIFSGNCLNVTYKEIIVTLLSGDETGRYLSVLPTGQISILRSVLPHASNVSCQS